MGSRLVSLALALGAIVGGCDTLTPCPALDCAFQSVEVVLPANGSSDVPLNARIWMSGPNDFSDLNPPLTVTKLGVNVAGEVRQLGVNNSQGVQIFVPSSPLSPRTKYVVLLSGKETSSFTTGTATLDTAPPAPALHVTSRHTPTNNCDGPVGTIQLDPPGALNLAIVAGQEANFDVAQASGAVVTLSTDASLTLTAQGCGNWDGKSKIRFGALNIAGRFSGWSEPL